MFAFFYGSCDVGLPSFLWLLGKWVGSEDSVVATVGPASARVFGVWEDQDSRLLVVYGAGVVDPTEFLSPGPRSIEITSIVGDSALSSLDAKRAGNA